MSNRETLLQGQDPLRDEEDLGLRPKVLQEIVGQRDVVERIKIAVTAAKQRGDPLGHVLFDGPPGLGKTTFAMCIPHETNVALQITSGAVLKAPKDLLPYLTNAAERSVLFIDEIHRLPRAVEEYLYTAMEDFRVDIILGDGVNARTINFSIQPFTLIGATTRAGMLSGPLRDRFQLREHLGFYTLDELAEIVRRNSEKLGVPLEDAADALIAARSRGTPRVAINRLRWTRDYAQTRAEGRITPAVAEAALKMADIDELGLEKLDRMYLRTLIDVFGGGPTGVEALAHTMNTSIDTLSDEVEPFLLRSAMVVRTPRGRVATAKSYQHLGLSAPDPQSKSPADDQKRLF